MKSSLRFSIACVAFILIFAQLARAQNLLWSQADAKTIFRGQEAVGFDAYNSGRLNDLLIVASSNSILAGSDRGGVWLVSSNGSALPLSNTWDRPDINTMAFGFGNEKHVFAGGSGLYVTDYTSLLPYLTWLNISPQGVFLGESSVIYKITTVTQDTDSGVKSYVVVATSEGIWTSELPPAPAGPYNWKKATGASLPAGQYSGLASGQKGKGIVVVGFFKVMSAKGTQVPAIYSGKFDSSGTLNLSQVTIGPSDTLSRPEQIGYVSLDSCASQANRMYAAVYDVNGSLFDVLRSDDSGTTWAPTTKTFDDGDPNNGVINWSNYMGNSANGGWLKHISVSPTNPDSVTVPGVGGLRTDNGGTSWHSMGVFWGPDKKAAALTVSYHSDWHVARHHPVSPLIVFAATDGGLLNSYGLIFSPLDFQHFYSDFNYGLHTLEFGSYPPRTFEEESDTESEVAEGLIAGGLQDNGNVFLKMGPKAATPWTQVSCCDGGQTQFFNVSPTAGWLLSSYVNIFGTPADGWNPLVATAVLNFAPFITNVAVVPPIKKDPNGQKQPAGLNGQVRAVYRPSYMKGGRLMFALVGEQASTRVNSTTVALFPNSVFGLFAKAKNYGVDMEWEHLGDLPLNVSPTTVAAYDGDPVLCGGSDGRIYSLDPKSGTVQAMPMNVPFLNGQAIRILYHVPARPLCAYTAAGSNPPQSAVLQFNGVQWNPIHTFSGEVIFDIQVDETVSPEAIYVVTDNRVYSSPDGGQNWFTDSTGLPERFHGSQLKIVNYKATTGEKWLYLTTYGRSVWAANMAGHD